MKLKPFISHVWSNILGQEDNRKRFITLVVISAVLLIQVSPYWIPKHDAEGYLSIAKSIAAGEGLTRHGNPHIIWAPGYPITISPLFLVFGHSFLSISVAHWCLLILFLFGTYVWTKRIAPEYALSVAILSATNVGVLYYFRRTLSEALFMPLLIWTAIALNELADRHKGQLTWVLPLASIAVTYLCVVRQAGLMLPLGFGLMMLCLAFKKRIPWTRAVLVAGLVVTCAVLAIGFLSYYDRTMATTARSEHTYFNVAVSLDSMRINQIMYGLQLRIMEVGRLLIPGAFKVYGGWLNPFMILYVPLFAAVCLGWFLAMRKNSDSLCYAFPLYLVLYIFFWPYDQGCRFMTPFVPLLWLSLVLLISRFAGKQRLVAAIVLMLPLSLITASVYLVKDVSYARKMDRNWVLLDAVNQRVPAGQTLGSILTSQHLNLMLQMKLGKHILKVHESTDIPPDLRFVVADSNTAIPPGFSTVYGSGQFLLLRRYPGRETTTNRGARGFPPPAPTPSQHAGPH